MCKGRCTVIKSPCQTCSGKGIKTVKKTIHVKIPAGVDTGDMLPVRGEGEPGQNGGGYGDLYVEFKVKKHEVFTRSVKEGTQPGDTYTFRGKGIPDKNNRNLRGDHTVRFLIEIPTRLTEEQKAKLREFDQTLTEKNYMKRNSFKEKLKSFFK